tara:strand:- start:2636 stop:3343 length:708 start_codon:yes stop_codon:yes gene_type:complete
MKPLLLLLALTLPAFSFAKFPAPDDRDDHVYMRAGGMKISKEGYNLIIKHEVGGGFSYYDRHLKWPAYVSKNSGITIGIGYDLRFNSPAQIRKDWPMLSESTLERLSSVSGKKGTRSMARSLRSISIPYAVALKVYNENTIPRFANLTRKAYPGVETLHPHIQGSMLSWVFNRGQGISRTSSRDREKRGMREAIPERPGLLAALFRASKRIWAGKGLHGLLLRREDEAKLCELTN